MEFLNYYKNKTVLVTGGAGAIGRNLCEHLAKLNAKKIIILDNLSSSFQWNIPDFKNIHFIKGDIRNDDDLRGAFHYKPEIIFHLAAFFANQNSVDHPLINEEVNIAGLLKVLEYAMISSKCERFVFTSSEGGAYGFSSSLPYSENDVSNDLSSPYYISKSAGESYCKFYHHHYELPIVVLRLFNSFGPGEVPGPYRNVIPNFIYGALQKQPLTLTGSKAMSRDFVFVQDIVDGILRAGFFSEAMGESINIATGREINIYALAEMINRKLRNESGVNVTLKRKWDTRERIIGDTTKARKILNFEATTEFEKGIDLTIEWFLQHIDKIIPDAAYPPGIVSALDVGV